MKLDARLAYAVLGDVPGIVKEAERIGFDGLQTSETDHDPFLAIALAAERSSELELRTAIALAFTRSPTTLAYTGWDLAHLSGGRFSLGLGTQVKAHITRRFGMAWDPPAPKLRDVIGAIRAVWACWSERRPLDYCGRYFNLSLMTPFFTPPGPAPAGLRIEIAGVGARMCRLAGEAADGFHVHPLHTRRYLREVVLREIGAGLRRSGRSRRDFTVSAGVFVAAGRPDEITESLAEIRGQLAFYASTPAYRALLDLHGWGEVGQRLSGLASQGRWREMPGAVPDEMLDACAVWGPPEEVGERLAEEYRDLADRIGAYEPLVPGRRAEVWQALISRFRREA